MAVNTEPSVSIHVSQVTIDRDFRLVIVFLRFSNSLPLTHCFFVMSVYPFATNFSIRLTEMYDSPIEKAEFVVGSDSEEEFVVSVSAHKSCE